MIQRNKKGRPVLDQKYKKTKTLQIKMNEDEYVKLISTARKLGGGNVSEGIRCALRIVAEHEPLSLNLIY